MEAVVFADTPTKRVGDSLLTSLETWDGPVTLLCSQQDVADSFQANRDKPFTRCVVNSRWAPSPLPPMTASVESNILSVLTWQQEQQTRKMLAFQSVADTPQADLQLFLLASRGIVNATPQDVLQRFHNTKTIIVLTAQQTPAFLIVPQCLGAWFFAEWIRRHTQASQEMLDSLLDTPLTLDAYHKEISTSHSVATFQWLAQHFSDRVVLQDVDLLPGEFAASALARAPQTPFVAATEIPVNDVTGTGTAWLFFALVAVVVVLGIGIAVGGVRASRAPSALEARWNRIGKL